MFYLKVGFLFFIINHIYKLRYIIFFMFVLVEFNNNYKEILKELKKLNFIPIVLFNLNLNNKINYNENLNKINEIIKKNKIKYKGIILNIDKNDNKLIGIINNLKLKFDLVIGLGGLNKINRFFLENTNIDFLLDPQNSKFKNKIDFIHHFNSGLNQVLFNFAKNKNISFIFSLNEFNKKYPNNYLISKEIGRINQNIKLCEKFKITFYLNYIIKNKFEIKNINQLNSIISLFNTSTKQKKENIYVLENKIQINTNKNTLKYINEFIKFK